MDNVIVFLSEYTYITRQGKCEFTLPHAQSVIVKYLSENITAYAVQGYMYIEVG